MNLAVNHILTGTIQKLDDKIKITVELRNALADEVEWSLSSDLRATHKLTDLASILPAL